MQIPLKLHSGWERWVYAWWGMLSSKYYNYSWESTTCKKMWVCMATSVTVVIFLCVVKYEGVPQRTARRWHIVIFLHFFTCLTVHSLNKKTTFTFTLLMTFRYCIYMWKKGTSDFTTIMDTEEVFQVILQSPGGNQRHEWWSNNNQMSANKLKAAPRMVFSYSVSHVEISSKYVGFPYHLLQQHHHSWVFLLSLSSFTLDSHLPASNYTR